MHVLSTGLGCARPGPWPEATNCEPFRRGRLAHTAGRQTGCRCTQRRAFWDQSLLALSLATGDISAALASWSARGPGHFGLLTITKNICCLRRKRAACCSIQLLHAGISARRDIERQNAHPLTYCGAPLAAIPRPCARTHGHTLNCTHGPASLLKARFLYTSTPGALTLTAAAQTSVNYIHHATAASRSAGLTSTQPRGWPHSSPSHSQAARTQQVQKQPRTVDAADDHHHD